MMWMVLWSLLTVAGMQSAALLDIQLALTSPDVKFVEQGQEVVLPCFGDVDWSGSDAALVQWERWNDVVLKLKYGVLYIHPLFKGRVYLLNERIRHGDISLHFNDTRFEDQGYFTCLFKENGDVRQAKSINLTISEKISTENSSTGSEFHLPLHNETSVIINFLPKGGTYTVPVCEVKGLQLTCTRNYTERVLLSDNTLILNTITSADNGTFLIRQTDTSRTITVIFLLVIRTGTKRLTGIAFLVVPLVLLFVIFLVIPVLFCYKRRSTIVLHNKGLMDLQDEIECQPMQSAEDGSPGTFES